jgi:APA family basic amino acid/polyamine antiporter
VAGVFSLRRRGMLAFRMPGYPLVPLFYLLTCTMILVLAFLERPMESSIALLTVAVGVPVYLIFKARTAVSTSS